MATCDILCTRLTQAESDFLHRMQRSNDLDSLTAFFNDWSGIRDDIKVKVDSQTLQDDLAGHAFSTASRVELLAQSFLDLQISIDDITAKLLPEAEAILDEEHNNIHHSVDPGTCEPMPNVLFKEGHCAGSTRASKVSSARCNASWLLANVHNPYPSAKVKKDLAATSGCTTKSLDDWFTNARRKIGWTAFSKRYFQGNRALTLDCAQCVLLEGNSGDTYCKEIIRSLEKVKFMAEHLYNTAAYGTTALSCFAKELDRSHTPKTGNTGGLYNEGSSTSPPNGTIVSSSCSQSSCSLSRKRPRDCDESYGTSQSSETHLLRPLKHSRGASSFSSSLSREPSLTSCSSESSVSLNELTTPAASPSCLNLPLELVDGWIDGIAAESAFLPHDVADKPPSVLSHKRHLLDSAADVPTKRVRLQAPQELPAGSPSDVPVVVSTMSVSASQISVPSLLLGQSRCQDSLAPPLVGNNPDDKIGVELDEEALDQIISQLDFSTSQAPVSIWDESLSNSILETSLFDFSSLDTGKGLSSRHSSGFNEVFASIPVVNAPLTTSEEALLAACVPQQNSLLPPNAPEALISNANDFGMAAQDTSCNPISFSALDLEFLESLGIAPQPRPQDAPSSSAHNQDVPTTLVDVPSSSQLADLTTSGPEPANKLVSEAYRLQQEVFG